VRPYVYFEKAQCLAALRAVALFLSDVSTFRGTGGVALMTDCTSKAGRQTYACKRAFYSQHEWSLRRDKEHSNIYLPIYQTTDRPLRWSHDVAAPFTVTCPALPAVWITTGTEHRSTEHFVALQNVEETVISDYPW